MAPDSSPQFSFAVITDSHINQSETECNSPFAVNRLANRRLRYVIDALNRQQLTAVFHLGDVVHPVPSMGARYADAAACFHAEARRLRHPLHLIPGNHDVGDKAIAWGPAGTVRDDFLEAWSTHFGAHYFHVQYHGAHFIGINAQLPGSGLKLENTQRQWLETTLDALRGERIFLLSHYPPFLVSPTESEHYDNLGEASRAWLLGLLEEYSVEALFAGHVHHFWYNRYADCDCYLLPATSFVRQDYSEMFRVPPGPEFGRNDAPKLGYFLIHVYPARHDFEMVRSFGRQGAAAIADNIATDTPPTLTPVNPRTNRCPRLGFDLRHDWMEQVQIPPSGGLDELDRKWVRNDYGLLALWEMGVRRLRVPLQDLAIAARRQRLAVLRGLGFGFDSYLFGGASAAQVDLVLECAPLLDSVDVIIAPGAVSARVTELVGRLRAQGLGVRLSPLRSKRDIMQSGRKYYHVINHGLTVNDFAGGEVDGALRAEGLVVDGYCWRAGVDDDLLALCAAAARYDRAHGLNSVIYLRLAADNPAVALARPEFVARRLAEALFLSWAVNGPPIFSDALTENERGYFPRSGVLDRLYNPEQGFFVVRNLHAIFNQLGDAPPDAVVQENAAGYVCTSAKGVIHLCCKAGGDGRARVAQGWDLVTGRALAGEEVSELWVGQRTED